MTTISQSPLARAARITWQNILWLEQQLDRDDLSEGRYVQLMSGLQLYRRVLADLECAIARQAHEEHRQSLRGHIAA